MQLDLPFGPWSKMASAHWGDYPLTIYQNPDKEMLLALFEKDSDKVKGVLTYLKKGFVVEGDPSKFLPSQRRDLVLISKYSREHSGTYLLVSSSPTYIEYNQDSLVKAITAQHAELEASAKVTIEIMKGFDCRATDFKAVPADRLSGLLGDPFSIFSFFSLSPGGQAAAPSSARCMLGIDHGNDTVEAKLSSFRMMMASGGRTRDRLHAMHVVIEDALLNNIPVMIFDTTGSFTGLAIPSKDTSKYEEFHLNSIPLGFPFKQFELEKGLFIDLSNVTAEVFLRSFYLEKSDLAGVIKRVYVIKESAFSTLSDLVVALSEMQETPEFTKYAINKAVRAVEVIQKSTPSFFAKNNVADLSGLFVGVGKVVHVNLFRQQPEIVSLATYSLLEPLTSAVSTNIRMLVVFEQDVSTVSEDIIAKFRELSEKGVGIAVHAEHDLDLSRVKRPATLKFEIVGSEAVVTEEGEKQRRISIRPAYSHDSEF